MAVETERQAETKKEDVELLPDLQVSTRPQEQIEVGILPLPTPVKTWLYRTFSRRSPEPDQSSSTTTSKEPRPV